MHDASIITLDKKPISIADMREDELAKSGTLRNTRNSTFQNLFEDRLNRMSGKRDRVQVTIDADDAGAQREYSSKPLKHSIFKRILVLKR